MRAGRSPASPSYAVQTDRRGPVAKEFAMSLEAIIIQAGEGKALSLRGTQVAYKAEGERPGGGPTFLEFTAAPGFNTGDHVHSRVEEIFYIVDGEFQIRAGERTLRARPGDFVLVPPGVAHGFGNAASTPAKMVLLISPAGVHERYFEELSAILGQPGPPDVQAIADLRLRYDTQQVSALRTES
jgi:quercetin dioxygenase-like cupin family protein